MSAQGSGPLDVDARTETTGAPTDLVGGMPATADGPVPPVLPGDEVATLRAIADHLIPAAHGMPSAAEVLTDARLQFVLRSRPDLVQPLRTALRPELGGDVADRLAALAPEPTNLSSLQLTIVAGYYTDADVRERIGYPGQVAQTLYSWKVPPYIEEGLIDAVVARGPVWRDPATGRRAEAEAPSAAATGAATTGGTADPDIDAPATDVRPSDISL
jgi:hypothetical protein